MTKKACGHDKNFKCCCHEEVEREPEDVCDYIKKDHFSHVKEAEDGYED